MVSGWIIINDADADTLELAVEDWEMFFKTIPEIDDLPGDARTGFDLGYRKRTLVLIGVRFDSRSDYEECLEMLDDWNDENPYTIEIRTSTGGTLLKQDGINNNLKYLYIDITEAKKIGNENIQQYRIGRITFKEAA